ncbi:MAG: hypothetical protein EHM12_11240 [Dehalococcoidia bacterium]|nr:MAG: hypothetical protein EHM12_11240 [Dehalococcoidia bacterium]
MAKDPAVLFYTADFLTRTSRLTDEQVGQYIRALCSQHQEGHFTKDELYQILKSYDSPVWKKFIIDDNGFYYNERMQEEIEKRINYCNSKSHKGISGRKNKSYDYHTVIIRKSSENHTENGNENDNINGIDNEDEDKQKICEHFIKWYSEYPNKTGKGAALKSWNKIKNKKEISEKILESLKWQKESEQWKKDNGQYIPNPSTYINQQRWMDEPKTIKNYPNGMTKEQYDLF